MWSLRPSLRTPTIRCLSSCCRSGLRGFPCWQTLPPGSLTLSNRTLSWNLVCTRATCLSSCSIRARRTASSMDSLCTSASRRSACRGSLLWNWAEAIDCCNPSGAMLLRPGWLCSCCCSACPRHAALPPLLGCSQTSARGRPAAACCLDVQTPTCGCSGGLGIQVPGLRQGSSPFSAAHLHLAGNVRHDYAGSHRHSCSTVQVPGKVAVLGVSCTHGTTASQSHAVAVQGSQIKGGLIKVAHPSK